MIGYAAKEATRAARAISRELNGALYSTSASRIEL
jgi:hypothetical protein